MQTTFDGPFGNGTGCAAGDGDTLVVMRTEDGGLDILADASTLALSPDDVRTLLFYGSTVELEASDGGLTALLMVDPRRYAVVLTLRGRQYAAPRWAITAVARGRLPAAYLQAPRASRRAPALTDRSTARRMADA